MECIADQVWFIKLITASIIIVAILSMATSSVLAIVKIRETLSNNSAQNSYANPGRRTGLSSSDARYKVNHSGEEGTHVTVQNPTGQSTSQSVNDMLVEADTINMVIQKIIINIAIIDIVVAGSHFWGSIQNYYIPKMAIHPSSTNVSYVLFNDSSPSCVAQASLTVYSTYVSFLLTVALAVLAVCALWPKRNWLWTHGATLWVGGVLCWGLPLLLTISFGMTDILGYAEGLDAGWCFVRLDNKDRIGQVAGLLFSYWLWLIIIIVVLVVLCVMYMISLALYSRGIPKTTENVAEIGKSLAKVIVATSMFAAFRLVGFFVGVFILYKLQTGGLSEYHCSPAFAAGLLISSILDTAQGLLNCVVFLMIPWVSGKLLKSRCIKGNKENYTVL